VFDDADFHSILFIHSFMVTTKLNLKIQTQNQTHNNIE
jgi:hypothetical protein